MWKLLGKRNIAPGFHWFVTYLFIAAKYSQYEWLFKQDKTDDFQNIDVYSWFHLTL